MKTKVTSQQKTKIHIYLKQVGLWNEAIGFIFLALAAGMAVVFAGTARNNLFGGFLSFFSFAASFEVTLWLITGILYLGSGWYLRQDKRNHTTAILIGTIVLSVLAVLNLIPLIPLVLSITVLAKANKLGINLDSPSKSRKRFNLKRQPDLIVALILVGIVAIALGVTNISGVHTNSKPGSGFAFPKPQYAICDTTSPANSCTVTSTQDSFRVTFPAKPVINVNNNDVSNPTDPSMPSKGIRHTSYSTYTAPNSNNSNPQRNTYEVDVIDFGQPIDTSLPASSQQEYQTDRLENGPDPASQFCDSKDPSSLNGTVEKDRLQTSYQGLPAMQVSMTGKSFGDEKCTYSSLSVLKVNKVYTISYTSIPSSSDATPFTQFLQSFSLIQ